jgi:hypothetical protein
MEDARICVEKAGGWLLRCPVTPEVASSSLVGPVRKSKGLRAQRNPFDVSMDGLQFFMKAPSTAVNWTAQKALASSLVRNQPHGLQELPTRLRATQQPHMLGPALGEGLPASHLGAPTTLRTKNGHQRRVLCHGSTPSRLCLGGSAVLDSEGIRRASSLVEVSYHRSP